MKYDLEVLLKSYDGRPFTRPVIGSDGQPVAENGVIKQESVTLRGVLETACLNADPQQYNNGTQKMLVFNLLMKIHQASPVANLTAEEVAMLKDLIGKQLTIGAVGAVYQALEKPISE